MNGPASLFCPLLLFPCDLILSTFFLWLLKYHWKTRECTRTSKPKRAGYLLRKGKTCQRKTASTLQATTFGIWTFSVSLQCPSIAETVRECFEWWTRPSVSTVLSSLSTWPSPHLSWAAPPPAVQQTSCGSCRACGVWWGTRQTQCYRKWWCWRIHTS